MDVFAIICQSGVETGRNWRLFVRLFIRVVRVEENFACLPSEMDGARDDDARAAVETPDTKLKLRSLTDEDKLHGMVTETGEQVGREWSSSACRCWT